MPVHTVATSEDTPLHWYETNGCIAFRGRLYFLIHDHFNSGVIRAAMSGGLLEFVGLWADMVWPVPDYSVSFRLAHTTPCCIFICERPLSPWKRLRYIDHINPAFRRLQRWFRTVLWKNRQEQRLQFALAAHGWLHNDLVRVIGLLIK